MSEYDAIARLYDPWSRSVTEDVGFYVDEAVRSGGPVLELGVGTGRIAVPVAATGIRVIGVDSSAGMLERCRESARLAGVQALVDLRLGDLREPPVEERVPLVISPFRAFLHLADDAERLGTLRAAHGLLLPGGRLVFDVFRPSRADIEETHGRWMERERGIWERALWDERGQRLVLTVKDSTSSATMALSWTEPDHWASLLADAGFRVLGRYGWFDRRPYRGGEDTVWVAERD